VFKNEFKLRLKMRTMSTQHHDTIKVVIAGIPNSGKSTLVSRISGVFVRTANYPGTTVSVDEVSYSVGKTRVLMVDLPGTYSLRTSMTDEAVASKELLLGDYDGIVVVGSALNPEQSLYLLVQVLELGKPTIFVLNMMDLARRRRVHYNVEAMSKTLGVTIIPAVAVGDEGLRELKTTVVKIRELKTGITNIVNYGKLEKHISTIMNTLGVSRGIAVEILSGNPLLRVLSIKVSHVIEEARREVPNIDYYVTAARWSTVKSLVGKFVTREGKLTLSKYDELFLNPKYGVLLSLLLLFTIAEVIFMVLEPLVNLMSNALDSIPIGNFVSSYVGNELLSSFLINGVWNGVTTLIDFIPYVFGVSFLIAFLEDSGLITRIAFPIERWLRRTGIPSRGLVYLIAGSGCNIPAIMATRAMPSTRDRVLTVLMIPYIPCTARFAIIALIAAAVMPHLIGVVVVIPYVVAFISISIVSRISRVHVRFINENTPYTYELPPLVVPLHKAFTKKIWHYTHDFISRAGVLIIVFIMMTWLLSVSGPRGLVGPEALANPSVLTETWLGIVGKALAPLFNPIGIPWQISASLVYGYIFKEVVLGTLALFYGTEKGGLLYAIGSTLTPASSLALITFITLYSPCIATLIVERKIAGLRLTAINTILQFIIALILAYAVFYIASFIQVIT